jgi:hypothetical protein
MSTISYRLLEHSDVEQAVSDGRDIVIHNSTNHSVQVDEDGRNLASKCYGAISSLDAQGQRMVDEGQIHIHGDVPASAKRTSPPPASKTKVKAKTDNEDSEAPASD